MCLPQLSSKRLHPVTDENKCGDLQPIGILLKTERKDGKPDRRVKEVTGLPTESANLGS